MNLACDAVVIGAGPGGAAAAYWLARAGAAVVLLDRASFPRDKPCGDGLTPAALDQLRAMGLSPPGRPYDGLRVYGAAPDQRIGAWRAGGDRHPAGGMVLARRSLDAQLCQHAVRAGARFVPGFSVGRVICANGALIGVEGQAAGQAWQLSAPVIIVATGANRSLLPMFGLPRPGPPQALAMRGYVELTDRLDTALQIYLDPELLPGYGWLFPTGDHSANLGVGVTLAGSPADGRRRLRAAFARLLGRPELAGATLQGQPQGYPLRTDFPAAATHAAGVLIVGETAGLVDPLTGEGIGLALESGRLAAEVATEALAAGDCSADRLGLYHEALIARYGAFFDEAHDLLARLDSPPVLRGLFEASRHDQRVGQAIRMAIIDQRPGASVRQLAEALERSAIPSARALFALNAYRPWIERCRAYLIEQVGQDAPHPAVVDLVSRGKLLRALLVFLGCRAAGGRPEQVLSGAAGIELVHAASLVHDDLIDRADERRGMPALHRQIGEARALVCGDYLIAKAFRLLAESRRTSPAAQVVEAFILGAESGVRACVGQFQDTGQWASESLTEAEYYRLIGNKTASVLSGALCAGATLAGGDQALLAALARYGECVGLAFQIKDDLFDLEALARGRAIDHKLSLPLVHAFQHATPQDRAQIIAFLDGDTGVDSTVADLLQAHASLTYAEESAATLVGEAMSLAANIPVIGADLAAFAIYTTERFE